MIHKKKWKIFKKNTRLIFDRVKHLGYNIYKLFYNFILFMNKVELQESSNYRDFLSKINNEIETIKEAYSDPLDWILQYNKFWVCTTLFWEKESVSEDYIFQKEKEISKSIDDLETIKKSLEQRSDVPTTLKVVYINSFDCLKDKLSMFKSSLWIEWEKSWFQLPDELRQRHHNIISNLQKKIYWEKVSDTPEEIDPILNKLHTLFEKNKGKLNQEEEVFFESFLLKEDKKLWFTFNKPEEKETKTTINSETKKVLEKNIDKRKLRELSEGLIAFYKKALWEDSDLSSRKTVEKSDIGSINVSWISKEIRIPEKYENSDYTKITSTITSHEIEQHLLQRDNTNRILWKWFSSWKYDFISEWVAKLNEDIAAWKINSINDLKKQKDQLPTIGIIWVFICENYNYEDSVKIIKIYNKLSSKDTDEICEKKAIDIVKRRKRFFPYNMPWSSIKDTLYQRWKNRVIDYLTQDWSLETAIKRYKELNTFKFWPEEQAFIEKIKSELNLDDDQIIYTMFIWRILHDKINKWKWSANNYLREMKLNTKDIDFNTKKELIEILRKLKNTTQNS